MNTNEKKQGTAELARTDRDDRTTRHPLLFGAGNRRDENPFGMMRRLSDEMDQLLNRFGFGGSFPAPWRDTGFLSAGVSPVSRSWVPQVEMFERDNQLVVRADLPGMHKEDLYIEVHDEWITIRGERREQQEENRGDYYHSERRYGSFFRRIPLPEGTGSSDAKASYRDGVLEITMPAPERKQQGREIEIQ